MKIQLIHKVKSQEDRLIIDGWKDDKMITSKIGVRSVLKPIYAAQQGEMIGVGPSIAEAINNCLNAK